MEEEVWDWLCSPVGFMATTLNPESKDWGLWLKIKTRNGFWHKVAIPKTELVTSSEDIFRRLAYHGLEFNISPRGKNKLKELLTRIRPRSYALCVPKIGFHDGVFILPNQAIGDTKGRAIVFQPARPTEHYYRQSGSLKGWQDGVAKLARGNDRLMFAISAAFARRSSSRSAWKAAAFICAAARRPARLRSCAPPVRSGAAAAITAISAPGEQRTTRLKQSQLLHNNAFLALDDLAEIEPKALSRAAYALANGHQKERMGKNIELRDGSTWRLLFMSAGEIGMAEKLSEDRHDRKPAARRCASLS